MSFDLARQFGQLRSLKHQGPATEGSFEQVLKLLEPWPEAELIEQAIPYVRPWLAHLSCLAPRDWISLDAELDQFKVEHPAWPLARTLNLSQMPLGDKGFGLLLSQVPLEHICALELNHCQLSDEAMHMLLASPYHVQIEAVSLLGNQITFQGARALAQLPALRRLNLISNPIDAHSVRALTLALGPLEALEVGWNQLPDDAVVALAQAPFLSRFKRLDLSRTQVGRKGALALAQCGKLEQLEVLELLACGLDDEVCAIMLEALDQGSLRELNLTHNAISDRSCKALKALEHLQDLNLSSNPLSPSALRTLIHRAQPYRKLLLRGCHLGGPSLASLEGMKVKHTLDLRDNHLGAEGVRALARAKGLKGLKQLNLFNTQLNDQALTSLSRGHMTGSLEALDLGYNVQLRAQGMQAFAQGPAWTDLISLSLKAVRPSPESLIQLLQGPSLPQLEALDLSMNLFSADHIRALTSCVELGRFKQLNLSDAQWDDEAIDLIAQCPHLRSLEVLTLTSRQALTPEQIERLAASPYLDSLRELDVSGYPLTPAQRSHLSTLFASSINLKL